MLYDISDVFTMFKGRCVDDCCECHMLLCHSGQGDITQNVNQRMSLHIKVGPMGVNTVEKIHDILVYIYNNYK